MSDDLLKHVEQTLGRKAGGHNRIWLELERPRNKEHAEEICEQVNLMLNRLRKHEHRDHPTRETFFWFDDKGTYCYGGTGGYVTLSDNGHWFNLEYFGREDD